MITAAYIFQKIFLIINYDDEGLLFCKKNLIFKQNHEALEYLETIVNKEKKIAC